MLSQRKFSKKNNPFTCMNCKKKVPPSQKTCRNHCPNCLYSRHLDINPGDRASTCRGLQKPIGYTLKKSQIILLFECQKCRKKTSNAATLEDKNQADQLEAILRL